MFTYLENRPVHSYHIVHTVFDDWIPFCEVFIIPYMLWFPYMVLAVAYFIFFNKNKHEYYQLVFNLMMGMTIFLIVSYVYPNAQHIRPTEFPRDNIFTDAVKCLYRTDTPTNILPSIHVFNSLAIHMSLTNCEALRNHKGIRIASLTLTALIIMSTMFLKQHSVLMYVWVQPWRCLVFWFFIQERLLRLPELLTLVKQREKKVKIKKISKKRNGFSFNWKEKNSCRSSFYSDD